MSDAADQTIAQFTRAVAGTEEDPVSGIDTAIKWQLVWTEAIALAWRDEHFHEHLLKDPRDALKTYFNFDLGPYVKLVVRDATPPPAGALVAHKLGQAFGGWDPGSDPLTSEMVMALPPKPPVEDQAIALAFYNASGRAYPFTCC